MIVIDKERNRDLLSHMVEDQISKVVNTSNGFLFYQPHPSRSESAVTIMPVH
jgi:hypothetical protein